MKFPLFVIILIASPCCAGAQSFEPASECASCHERINSEWRESRHAHSSAQNNPIYAAMLSWAGDAEMGATCGKCHEPIATLTAADDPLRHEGVTCDFCHATKLTVTGGRTWFEPGPANSKYGPWDDAISSSHACIQSTLHSQSSFCLACHGNSENVHGVTFCSTGLEYQRSSFARKGVSCQDCHMPAIEGKAAPTGKLRQAVHKHQFYGAYDEEMLRDCATLEIDATQNGESVSVWIRLTNQSVGHHLPTGTPMRMVLLKVEALDAGGNLLWTNYRTNPLKEDPGAVLMKLLQDDQGRAPVPPWEAVSERFDQRLRADEVRELHYAFSDSAAVEIKAVLTHRLAPPPLIDRFGLDGTIYSAARIITTAQSTIKKKP